MLKRKIFILLIFVFVITSIYFHLPTKAVYSLLPIFLQFKYGISAKIEKINGGFKDGIVLSSVKLSKGATKVWCEGVVSDIKYIDLIFPDKKNTYNIYIKKPKVFVGNEQASGLLGAPFYFNAGIFISDAELSIEALGPDFPIRFNGQLGMDNGNLKIDNLRLSLNDLDLEIEGGIDNNKELDLSAHFINSENKFKVKGTLNNPQIYTHWSGLETLFKIENIEYNNGQLVLPRISGNIYIKGFPPVDLDGGLSINKDFIRFNNITVLNAARLNGVIAKDKTAKVRLIMDGVSGTKLAEKLPSVLKILILSHKVDADISIFGMMDALQGGGTLKLLSTPIEVACRYRKNIFSFRSIGKSVFDISGSINWNNIPSMKIKGLFNHVDIKEFMHLLGKEINGEWTGVVDGSFNIIGEMGSPLIESKLEISNAEFGNIKFDTAYINLSGTGSGPLNLEHSIIYYKEIPAELKGFIDPKEKDIFKNVEIHPTGDSFMWEGVNIVKDTGDKIVTFGKDINDNISVRFKSVITSDPEESGEEKKPEVEVEYKLKDNKNLIIKMKEDESTVGVGQKVKF